MIRHFTRLSTWNAAVDLGLYPLGSCTMKYNPKMNEKIARLPGFSAAHPLQPARPDAGLPPAGLRARAPARRDQRDGPRDAPAGGRRPGRAGGDHDDPRLPRAARREAAQGPDPRHRARHQPGQRGAERLPGDPGAVGRGRPAAPRGDRAAHDARGRRADDHQPEHARALRGAHRADRGDRPRQGRPDLRRRRQPERAARHHAARRPRDRRDALQPAQDLLDAARRRRTRRRARSA